MKQFDIIIGNPPYQKPSQGGNAQRDLWPYFVIKSLNILKTSGYLTLIHPNKWRKPEHKLWPILSQKQINYLEIHNEIEGKKIFNAITRYDWYVLKNITKTSPTLVIDENTNKYNINLNTLPCLPNYNIQEFISLLAQKNETKLNIIYSRSLHGNHQKYMSNEKNDIFKYPCVYKMNNDNISCLYSSKKSEQFIPKIILGIGRYLYPFIDITGEYGLTQNAFGIKINSLQEAKNIKNAIESPKFKEIIKATKWSNFQTDWRMFKYFKKNFWKNFTEINLK